jgi:hypothetical protein
LFDEKYNGMKITYALMLGEKISTLLRAAPIGLFLWKCT